MEQLLRTSAERLQRESKRQAKFPFRGEGVECCHEQTNVDFPKDVQRLRKLVGYLKLTSNVGVVLDAPEPGQGKWKNSDKFWVLDFFLTQTGVATKPTDVQQAAAYTC